MAGTPIVTTFVTTPAMVLRSYRACARRRYVQYRTQGPDRSTSRTWATFRSVSRVGDFWVLRVSPQMAMGLPVAALNEQQTTAFLTLLQEKGLDRTMPASAPGAGQPCTRYMRG